MGTHPVTATYSGTTTLAGSSDTVDQVVGLGATSTDLTSSRNPSPQKQPITFTATITTAAGLPVTTGTVQFTDGTTPIGAPVALSAAGTASVTTSELSVGSHTVRATYSGTATLAGSSDTLSQVVEKRRGPPPGRPRS